MLVPLTQVDNIGGKGQEQIFLNSSTEFEVLTVFSVGACLYAAVCMGPVLSRDIYTKSPICLACYSDPLILSLPLCALNVFPVVTACPSA